MSFIIRQLLVTIKRTNPNYLFCINYIKYMSFLNKDHKQNEIKKDVFLKFDSISRKGQKILAALYLVTNHLADTDPLKIQIRTAAISLAVPPRDLFSGTGGYTGQPVTESFSAAIYTVSSLLEAAYLARIISEKNYAILKAELLYFAKSVEADTKSSLLETVELTTGFFTEVEKPLIKDTIKLSKGHIVKSFVLNRNIQQKESINKKIDRSQDIVSFVNAKKMVSIKDISILFPSVSEKTIQRELNRLLSEGKLRKRGNKRWSMYLSLDA